MMTSRYLSISLLFSLISACCASAYADDEAAIRESIRAYVSHFNHGDASAVAALWHADGVWISPDGARIQGRDAIESEMKLFFADGGGKVEIVDPQIRILAPTVAVEEGQARVARPGELPSDTSYIAIHVKEGDNWKLESVRETAIPAPPSNFDKLKDLDWMVGTWVDQDDLGTIETTCKWTKNRNFLTRSFTVSVEGQIDLEGTQVIGYDGARDQIRSWVFDTAGGFSEGVWTRDGDSWLIKSSQTLQDGRRASSINKLTYVDDNTFNWESTGREIAGEFQPNVDPVVVRRRIDTDDTAPSTSLIESGKIAN